MSIRMRFSASLHICIFASSSSLLTTVYFHPLATHTTDLDKASRIYFAALVYGRKTRICSTRSRATMVLLATAVPVKPVRRTCEFASTAMATSPYRPHRPLMPPAQPAVRPQVRSSPSLPSLAKCCSHGEGATWRRACLHTFQWPLHFAHFHCKDIYLCLSLTVPTSQHRFPHSVAGFCSMISLCKCIIRQ